MTETLNQVLKICQEEGVEVTAYYFKKHWRLETDHGRLTAPSTPGCKRWSQNFRKYVRRVKREKRG